MILYRRFKFNQSNNMINFLQIIIHIPNIWIKPHQTTKSQKIIKKMKKIKLIIHHRILIIVKMSSRIIHQLIQIFNQTKMKQQMNKLKTNLILQVIPVMMIFLNKIRLILIIFQVKTKLNLKVKRINQTQPI